MASASAYADAPGHLPSLVILYKRRTGQRRFAGIGFEPTTLGLYTGDEWSVDFLFEPSRWAPFCSSFSQRPAGIGCKRFIDLAV